MTPQISIVLGTYNRMNLLLNCIHSIREAVNDLDYKIIVADGGSTDGSRIWLAAQKDIVFLGERALHGACDAYNKMFHLAQAPFIAHLNDDDVCHPKILSIACSYLQEHPEVGQIAFPFRDNRQTGYGTGYALGLPYANKGMTRKWLGDLVGWWGTDYRKYAGDTELSLNIWMLGYKVVLLEDCKVDHYPPDDELRTIDQPNVDSAKFYAKWGKGCLHPPTKPVVTEGEA